MNHILLISILMLSVNGLAGCGSTVDSGGEGGSGGDTGGTGGTGGGSTTGSDCSESNPCEDGYICVYDDNSCGEDTTGTCEIISDACPEYYGPVCGCDGNIYDNECFAHMAGVNITEDEFCGITTECTSNDNCDENSFCVFDSGCSGTGTCTEIQDVDCTQEYDPVCGCDGETYGNACSAATAGVSIDYEGECECGLNADCG